MKEKITSQDIFKSTSVYYARYRLGYPQELISYLKKELTLDGTGTLLDLGCGTGQLALQLSPFFKDVDAVDASSEMIDQGRVAAATKAILNINWYVQRAEDINRLTNEAVLYDTVTIGNAFHHMDREVTLKLLDNLVKDHGCLVILYSGESLRNRNTPWKKRLAELIEKYVGEKEQVQKMIAIQEKKNDREILKQSTFSDVRYFQHTYPLVWTMDSILGHLYSTSYCSTEVLGNKNKILSTN